MATEDPEVPARADRHAVDPKSLELLVCPLTKTRLVYDAAAKTLISVAAGLAFPIRNGVPLMIEDAARHLTDDDLIRASRAHECRQDLRTIIISKAIGHKVRTFWRLNHFSLFPSDIIRRCRRHCRGDGFVSEMFRAQSVVSGAAARTASAQRRRLLNLVWTARARRCWVWFWQSAVSPSGRGHSISIRDISWCWSLGAWRVLQFSAVASH